MVAVATMRAAMRNREIVFFFSEAMMCRRLATRIVLS
jgi:hypothetical protein